MSAEQDDTCTSGSHSIAPFGDVVYPQGGNGGYKSVHTDTNLNPRRRAVEPVPRLGRTSTRPSQATQCLTDFSFDFETKAPQFPNTGSATDDRTRT